MWQFVLLAFATFASEDLACLAAGALIAAGKMGFITGTTACLVGIYVGDMLLFLAGRWIGRPILKWRAFRDMLTDEKLEAASNWLAKRGAAVVVVSRFTPGLRLPTYFAAGLLRTHFWTFSLYFLLAALLWTPLLVGVSAVFGRQVPRLAFVAPGLILAAAFLRQVPGWRTRRLIQGWFRRHTRWEFWPPWLAYLPVVPYMLYLSLRHRSLTLFTAANPGIPSGGFVGESKSAILRHLSTVPEYVVLPEELGPEARLLAVNNFLRTHGLSYPVVLKPDVGERGTGVAVVRSDRAASSYFATSTGATIVQKHVGGLEFGVFYYRHPHDDRGRIFSITDKRFPFVTGDGTTSIRDLVLRDERAFCLASMYLGRLKRDSGDVPRAGEVVPLAELGSHCRGAVFLNGGHLETEALRASVDAIASAFRGFYFGRFDVRSPSLEDFQAGRFEILELNGVSAEATHIYDPSVSQFEAYRVLFTQWRIAFAIGAANRDAGFAPMPFWKFVNLVRFRGARSSGGPSHVTVLVPQRLP